MKTFSKLVAEALALSDGRVLSFPAARRLAIKVLRADGEPAPARSLWRPLAESIHEQSWRNEQDARNAAELL